MNAKSDYLPLNISRRLRVLFVLLSAVLVTQSRWALAQADFEKGYQAYQSYHGTDFDTVNLANGNLVLNIPLLSYEQRGGLPPVTIAIRSNSTTFQSDPPFSSGPNDTKQFEVPSGALGSPAGQPHVMISPGGLYWKEQRITLEKAQLSRFVAYDDSGATHSLGGNIANTTAPYIGNIRYSVDGSDLMLTASPTAPVIIDRNGNIGGLQDPDGNAISLHGPCAKPAGSGQFYNASLPAWEGYAYGTASATSIVDSVERVIPNPTYVQPLQAYSCLVDLDTAYYPATGSSDSACPTAQVANTTTGETGVATGPTGLPLMASDFYDFPSQNGTTVRLTFCYQKIKVSAALPNVQRTTTQINEVWPVLTGAILPNGTSWVFVYDTHGQVLSVTMPTGATTTYAYGGSTNNMRVACGNPPGEIPVSGTPTWPFLNLMSNRMVAKRTLTATNPDGTISVQQWTYASTIGSGWGSSPNSGTVTVTDAMGNDIVHTYSLIGTPTYGQPVCGPYETNVAFYQGSSTSVTPVLIKQVATQYTSSGIDHANPTNFSNYIANGVLPTTVTTALYDGVGGTQVQQDAYVHDKFGSYQDYKGTTYPFTFGQKLVATESDWSAGSPGLVLRTSLFTNQWQSYWKYWAANLVDLPCLDTIFTGTYAGSQPNCTAPAPPGNQASQTSFFYDESGYIQGNVIGAQTTVTRWLNSGSSPSSHTEYGADAMPIWKVDPNGNTTFIQYDTTGLYPYKITHAQTGSVTHIEILTYDAGTGELLAHQDENQNVTNFQYDNMRRLTTTDYPDGGQETFTYNDAIPPSYVFTKTLNSVFALYTETGLADSLGRKVQTQINSDPLGTIYANTTYDTLGRVATQTNPFHSTGESTYGVTSFTYDAIGRKTIQTQPDGSKQMWCYQNLATNSQTNCHAQLAKTGSAVSNGSFVDFRDELSHDWQRNSDGLGRLASVMEPNGSGNAPSMQTTHTYDVLGNLTGVTQTGITSGSNKDTPRAPRTFTYDSLSRLATATNPETGAISYTYDANSNQLSRTQPLVNATSGTQTLRYCYDALNRKTAEYTGSLVGNCTSPSQITLANLISAYTYDTTSLGTPPNNAIGQMTDALEYTAGTAIWERSPYQFDKMGRLLNEQQCTFGSCSSYLSFGYTYDYASNVLNATTTTGLNGPPTTMAVTNYTYDSVARLSTLGSTSSIGEFQYMAKEYGPAGLTSASYGSVGLGSNETMLLSRLYDKRSRVTDNTVYTAGTQATGTITLACTKSPCIPAPTDVVTAVIGGVSASASVLAGQFSDLAPLLASAIQNASGMPVTATVSSNTITLTAIEYGKEGEVSLSVSVSAGAPFKATTSGSKLSGDTETTAYHYALTYAANNNVATAVDTVIGSWSYTYDTLNRLTVATTSTGGIVTPFGTFVTQCWTYDGFGNRTGEGEMSTGTTCPNPISGSTHSNVALYNTSNQITSNSVSTFVYDDAGNITNDGINKYVYNLDGRICAVTTVAAGGAITQYVYDAEGRRVAKGTLTTFPAAGATCKAPTSANGFAGVALFLRGALSEQQIEFDGSGNWRHTDVFSAGNLLATLNNNAQTPLSFNFSDWLGTKRLQSNFDGTTQNSWVSDPFGAYQKAQSSATDATERHFTGKERDNETGNDYFGARYYESGMGRWVSPDWSMAAQAVPYATFGNPQSLNLYEFVGNAPGVHIDPDGHCWPAQACYDALVRRLDKWTTSVRNNAVNHSPTVAALTTFSSGFVADTVKMVASPLTTGTATGTCLGGNKCSAGKTALAVGGDTLKAASIAFTANSVITKGLDAAMFGAAEGRVFWSGAGSEEMASQFGKVIGDTPAGNLGEALDKAGLQGTRVSRTMWNELSAAYARGAKGDVLTFNFNPRTAGTTLLETELPILEKSSDVSVLPMGKP